MKRIWVIASITVLVLLGIVLPAIMPTTQHAPRATSSDRKVRITGTCFRGSKPHPLDGTLRLVVVSDGLNSKQIQTSIPFSSRLSIKWIEEPPLRFFVVKRRNQLLMKFLVDDTGARCIEGMSFIAENPYQTEPPPVPNAQ